MKKLKERTPIVLFIACLFSILSCKETPNNSKLTEISSKCSEALTKSPSKTEIDSMSISTEDKVFLWNLQTTLLNGSKVTNWSENEIRNFEREMYFASQVISAKGSCNDCKDNYKLCKEGFPQGPFLKQSMNQQMGCATDLMWCILISCNYSIIFKQTNQ